MGKLPKIQVFKEQIQVALFDQEWIDPAYCSGITTRTIQNNDLHVTPECYVRSAGDDIYVQQNDYFCFGLQTGKIITEPIKIKNLRGARHIHSVVPDGERETLGQAILRHDCFLSLEFVTWTRVGYNLAMPSEWSALILCADKALFRLLHNRRAPHL